MRLEDVIERSFERPKAVRSRTLLRSIILGALIVIVGIIVRFSR